MKDLVDRKRVCEKSCPIILAALLLLVGASASKAQNTSSLPPETVKQIEALIESEKARLAIPGLSLAIAVDNQLRYAKGFGIADLENGVPAKATTVYRTASVAKSLTATAVMQLIEQGKMDLDAPIQKSCAAFPAKNWTITVRHLLTHQSGIRHYKTRPEGWSSEHYSSITDSLRIFKDEPLLFEPGTEYRYTTYGYSVLGCAIEGASGMSYEKYLDKHIFQPAGLERTRTDGHFAIIPDRARGYIKVGPSIISLLSEDVRKEAPAGTILNTIVTDNSGKIPGGGLVSTAVDLVKFAIALNTGKLVKSSTTELMWTMQKTKDGKETGYGFGWELTKTREPRIVLHTGNQAGASSALVLIPERGVVVVVMTNLSDAALQNVVNGIIKVLTGGN